MSVTNCKVIVVCANPDRVERGATGYPHHPQNCKNVETLYDMWEKTVIVEKEIDAGVPMDTIVVCNGRDAYGWWKDKDGMKTKNGTLKVMKRPNDGGSFAAYNHAYRNTNYYGYLFTEEDILVFGRDYYRRIIKRFREKKKKAGFICLIDASKGRVYPVHCHGGVGFTTRDQLEKVVDENGDLPHPKMKGWNQRKAILHGESPFTNCYLQHGMELFRMKEHKQEWCDSNFAKPYYILRQVLKTDDYNRLFL